MNDDLLGCWAVNRVVSARIEPSVHTCSGLARNTPFVAKRGETSLARTFTAAYKVWNATTGGVKKTRRRGARVFQVFFFLFLLSELVFSRFRRASVRASDSIRIQSPQPKIWIMWQILHRKGCQGVWRICTSLSSCCFHSLHDYFRHFSWAQWRESGETVREKVCYIILIHEIHCVSPLAFFFPPQHLQEMSFLSSFASRHVLEALYTN